MNTGFQFCSRRFNIETTKEHFLNPHNYGDDLAKWLSDSLSDAGYRITSPPQQEDFGWYFTFVAGETDHSVIVGFQPNSIELGDRWLGWIERQVHFPMSLLGGRHKGISPEAINAIDLILRSSSEINDVKWVSQKSLDT